MPVNEARTPDISHAHLSSAGVPPEAERVIGLLEKHAPKFQLRSGTPELRSSEKMLAAGAVRTDDIPRGSNACSARVLRYIASAATRKCTSLETGGGWSTCVLATVSEKHYCINPDMTAKELILGFLRQHDVNSGTLVFIDAASDSALPALDPSCRIDLALIDGNHSFPVPIIDWHYIDLHLNEGGTLLVDDTHIRSVRVLCEFLSTEDSYQKVGDIGTLAVFRKIAEQRVWGWGDQRFNRSSNGVRDGRRAALRDRCARLMGRFRRRPQGESSDR